jgi:hypothetical protein
VESRLQNIQDPSKHRLDIVRHLFISETQRASSNRGQRSISRSVEFALAIMNGAVQFDYQSRSNAVNFHDKPSDDLLPTEMKPAQNATSEPRPEQTLQIPSCRAAFL